MTRAETRRASERGFTLVEALVAMVVLTFGLIAITNLFIVAAGSNTIANHSTAAAAQAAEVMERLKSLDFNTLQPGGALTNAPATCDAVSDANDCMGPGNYDLRRSVDGVGWISVRWQITNPGAAGASTLFIAVRAWSEAALAGERSRAEFTTFRTCTMGTLCP
jgi:type II secretory pathway pseudopilin PulG